jgi:glutamyl/glutaminyl-tRNA synthetase
VEDVQKKLAAGESYVIRLKVPANQDIVFTDLLRRVKLVLILI